MKLALLLFILITWGTLKTQAQNPVSDSLKLILKTAKHDTTRCSILTKLIENEGDDKVWPVYNDQLLLLSEKGARNTDDKKLKFLYLKHLSNAYNNIGFLAGSNGDNAKTLEYLQKSLAIQEEIGDKTGISTSLNNLAYIYENQGDIYKAIELYHRSLKIREELQDKTGMANSLNNIGVIYDNQGDHLKALEYHKRGLKMLEEINDPAGIATALHNIGFIYSKRGETEKALEYYQKSLSIRKEINDKSGIANSLINIGSIYNKLNNIPLALEYYTGSLKIREEIKDKKGMARSLTGISDVLLSQGKVKEALEYGKRGFQLAQELGYPAIIKSSASLLKDIYRKQNNSKAALEMFELEIQMRDSINNTETKKASVKKQFQYEYEKKAAADSVKNAEEQKVKNAQLTAQQAQLKQEKTQRYALYGGLILIIAFSVFVFNRFKITQRQKVIIEKQKSAVDHAYEKLNEKNKEVMDSIYYARRIQRALITSEKYISKQLNLLMKKG